MSTDPGPQASLSGTAMSTWPGPLVPDPAPGPQAAGRAAGQRLDGRWYLDPRSLDPRAVGTWTLWAVGAWMAGTCARDMQDRTEQSKAQENEERKDALFNRKLWQQCRYRRACTMLLLDPSSTDYYHRTDDTQRP